MYRAGLLAVSVGVGLLSNTTLALAGAPTPSPIGGWLAAETVPLAIPNGANPVLPSVALLPDGAVVAFAASAGGVVELNRRPASTGKWVGTDSVVGVGAPIAVVAHEVTGAGEVVAIWLTATGVVTTATRSTTGVWSAPEALSAAGVEVPALAGNPDGGAVVVWRQANTLRSRTRTSTGAAWSPEATVTTSAAALGSPAAAMSLTGLIDVIYPDGLVPKFTRGALSTNVWSASTELPGATPASHPSAMTIRMDGGGGAIALWLEDGCRWRAAARDSGGVLWIAGAAPALDRCADAGGYFRSSFDLNRSGQGVFLGINDEGPGPDGYTGARKAAFGDPFLALPALKLYQQPKGDERVNGVATAITPNGRAYLSLTEGANPDSLGTTTRVFVTNVPAALAPSTGFIVGSGAQRNVVHRIHRLTGPTVAAAVVDPLNRVNTAMIEWRSSNRAGTVHRLRIAVRPGPGLRITRLTKLASAGRTAARVTMNQPATVTVTFTTRSGRRIGRVVRNVSAGATVVRLPGSLARGTSTYRVRVDAVNGGTANTRRA